MKRSPMPPRSGYLKRGTPLRAKGGARFKKNVDEPWRAYIRTLPCVIRDATCDGPTECAHVKSRGAGGVDRGNTVPLCTRHHSIQHGIGITSFEAAHNVNLAQWATLLGALAE